MTVAETTSAPPDNNTTVEFFLLVVQALFLGIFGILLFKIHPGVLPYNPDATYGLFMIIIALQAISLGKTPLGDFRQSKIVTVIGFIAVIFGLIGCFVPGVSSSILRYIVGIMLVGGGLALLVETWLLKDRSRMWWRDGGVTRHLAIACSATYLLMTSLGIITLFPASGIDPLTAILSLLTALAILYLVWSLWQVSRAYPTEWQTRREQYFGARPGTAENGIDLSSALVVMLAIILTLLGILLLFVGRGILPFSPDGQYGVLLTIMALQIGCLGVTPIGTFRRTPLITALAIVFVGIGIFSAVSPGGITEPTRILLGVMNTAAGVTLLIGQFSPRNAELRHPAPSPVAPQLRRLWLTQTLQGVVGTVFGLSALFPGMLSLTIT
ncbi:MAG: hypothetical protein FWG25_07620, partial [Promicromonosporaceae bacterium]|nr:hypothetical protein [Promicromonosporaceae bacterium]